MMLLSFMPSTFCSDEDDKVKALWFKGFEIFEDAEKVEKEQGVEKALPLYENALKHFKGIKIKYPDWNPSFIGYRINVCEKKIEKLTGSIATTNPTAKPAPTESPAPATTPSEMKLLKEKLDNTQKKLDNALVFVSKSQKEIDRGNKAILDLEHLSKDKSDLEKRYSLLSEELQKIRNNSFSESPETKNVMDKLRSQLDELNSKYNKTVQDNRELTEKYRNLSMTKVDSESVLGKTIEENQNMRKALAEALDSVKGMRTDLGESAAKSRKQEEEIANLKTIIEEEKKKSGTMDDKFREIAEKSGGLAEHLNSENELLKKDLGLLKIKLDSESREKKELQDKAVEKDVKIQRLDNLLAELGASSKKYASELEIRTNTVQETLKKNSEMAAKIKGLEEQNQSLSDEIKKIAAKYESFVKKDKEYTELAKYCLELEEEKRNNTAVIDKAKEDASLVRKELQSSMIKKGDFDRVSGELDNSKLTIVKLKEENASLAADKEKVMAEKKNVAEEKGKMTADLDRLSKDKEKLQEDICLVLKEKDKIAAERDALISGKNEFAAERDRLVAEKDKALSEKNSAVEEKGKLTEVQRQKDELASKILQAEEKLAKIQSDLGKSSDEKGKLQAEKDAILVEKNKIAAERDKFLSEKDGLVAERDKLIVEKDKLVAAVKPPENPPLAAPSSGNTEELAKMLEEKKAALTEIQKQKDELASKILQAEEKVAKLHTDGELAGKKLLDLSAANAELNRKIKESEMKVDANGNDMKELAKYCVTLKERNRTVEDSLKELQDKISKIEKENAELKGGSVQPESKIKDAKAANPENAEKDELVRKLIESQNELNSIKEKIALGTKPQENVADFSPDEKKMLFEAALKSLAEGNKDSALWHYDKILSKNPEDADACKYAAAIELEKGGTDRAIELYERAAKKYPVDKDLITGISYAYLKKGDYFSGMSYLSRGLASKPDDPDLLRNMGVACSSLGWKDTAEKLMRKSIGIKPDSRETLFNLAVLLAASEPPKLEEAEKLYRKALELGAAKDPGMEELFKKE